MKKILLTLSLFQGILSFGQNVGLSWVKNSGGTGMERGYSVAVDASGNVFSTGYFQNSADFNPGAGNAVFTSAGDKDIFVQKHDANGNFLWAKRMGGTGQDWALSIALDASGNVYTTGLFSNTVDFDPGTGVSNLTATGTYYDIFIQKLDANGNFGWVKQIACPNAALANAIHVDGTGNIYVTGTCPIPFNGTVDFDPGPGTYNLSYGQGPIFVLKLDAGGNFVWAKCFGGLSSDEGNSITTDAAGNVYTTGFFASTGDFDPGPGTYNLTAGTNNVFIQKLDADGNFVWAKQLTGGYASGNSIAVSPTGNVYVTGEFQGTIDLDPGPATQNAVPVGGDDFFILKLNTNGNFVWGKAIGGTNANDHANAIALDASENVYTTGEFRETIDFDPGPGTHNITATIYDMYILKLDQNGNFVWVKTTEGSDNAEYGQDIAVTASGGIYVAGSFLGTVDFDMGPGTHNVTASGYDAYVLKLGACQVSATDTKTACGSYTWINGVTYTANNNTATHTITAGGANGCDSVVTLNLTIKQHTSSILTQTACGSYTLNGQTYNTSGTYTQVRPNAQGCDSTITLNLTIKQNTSSTITQAACGSYTLNGTTYNTSGTYTQVRPNAQGCDSTITLNLTIKQNTSSTITQAACGSYTLNGTTYNTSGTYTQVRPNAQGCDSTITLNLTIKQNTSATITQAACGSYTLNGTTYNTSGTYTQVRPNAQGCDSTITLNLTINNVNAAATATGTLLTATPAGATYQWLDCNNANAPITGATAQTFTATVNGSYAVTVTANGCSATSSCVTVFGIGIDESVAALPVNIYPNPTSDYVNIDLGTAPSATMELTDMNGKTLMLRQLTGNATVDVSMLPSGIYYIKIQTHTTTTVTKLVKNN